MDPINIMIINTPMCVLAIVICLAAVAATFMAKVWSPLLSLIGLSVIYFLGQTLMPQGEYFFWGAAALIALGINALLPAAVSRSRVGMGYLAGATLAGALVGMIISHAGLIVGAVIGAFCGALAYSRTPSGRILQFPSSKFLHYLCAKGLPTVVNMCIFTLTVLATLGL